MSGDRLSVPPAPTPARPRLAAWLPFLVIALTAAACWLLVRPYGDFPLDDDWAYGTTARRLLHEGRLRLSDWSSPWALAPLLTGTSLARVFGDSYTVFRFGTLLWGAAGAAFLFQILRERGVRGDVAWLSTGLLFFNPLYFNLCFTYQTDVAFNALALGALYFFHRVERDGRARDEWLFAGVCTVAALTRQIGVALPAAAVAALFCMRRLTVGRFLRLTVLPAAAFLLFYFWLTYVHGRTWAQVNYLTWGTVSHLSNPVPFIKESAGRVMDSLLFAALCVGPLLLWRTDRPAAWTWVRRAFFTAGAALVVVYVVRKGALPYYNGVVHSVGLGTLSVHGMGHAAPESVRVFWTLCTAAAAAALVALWRRCLSQPVTKAEWAFLAVASAPAFCFLAGLKYFDRYMLQWTMGLYLFLPFFAPRRRVPVLSWALLAALAALSVAGTRDYFAWNRAKWELGHRAARHGIAPPDVANGFDWNAHWHYDKKMAELRAQKPVADIEEWEWEPQGNILAVVTAQPDFYPAGNLLESATYYSPLARGGARLYLFKRPPGDMKAWGR